MGIHEFIEEHNLPDEEKELLDSYMELHDDQKILKLKNVDFFGFQGGTEQLSHEVIKTTYNKLSSIIDKEGFPKSNEDQQKFHERALEYLLTATIDKLEDSNDERIKYIKTELNKFNNEIYNDDSGKAKKSKFMSEAIKEVLGLSDNGMTHLYQGLVSGNKSRLFDEMQKVKDDLLMGFIKGKRTHLENMLDKDYLFAQSRNAYVAKKHTDYIRSEFNPQYQITDVKGHMNKDYKTLTREHYHIKNNKEQINVHEALLDQGYDLAPEDE